jgi:hypothetical protein
MIYNPDVHKTKMPSRAERLTRTLLVAGGVGAGALLLAHAHNTDAAQLNSQPKKVAISVSFSDKTEVVPVKVNDTVGSIIEEHTKVHTTDAAKIPDYVAFDAAVDAVEAMPENKAALEDGILQADREKLVVPDAITVSPTTTESK